jgi:hypothetical protein
MTDERATDLVSAVQRDHREIEKMLDEVEQASGTARREAFGRLANKLQAHEEAEDKVVHPLAKDEGAQDGVEHLEQEENEASAMLARLVKMDCDSDEFTRLFADLKHDVLHHAQEEEQGEHKRLMHETSRDELERRGEMFEDAKNKAAKKK